MKRFEPTPSRLARARREGDHPLSRDLIAVAAFGGGTLVLVVGGPLLGEGAREALRESLVTASAQRLTLILAAALVAVWVAAAAGAVLATLVQTRGPTFRAPAWRLSFMRGFNAEMLRATARSALTVGAGCTTVVAVTAPHPTAIGRVVESVAAVGALGACVDLLASRAAWRRRLRMTHEELRRDLREHDGDPHTRGRRRRLHRSFVRGSLREIRRATFVVVNPTHLAVALRYAPPQTEVPEILVRAADERALRARRLAAEAAVPIVEERDLARQLYAHDALGAIPPEAYVAVAHVIARLERQR